MYQRTRVGARARGAAFAVLLSLVFGASLTVAGCGGVRRLAQADVDAVQPPDSLLAFTLFLTGDAGKPLDTPFEVEPALKLLNAQLEQSSGRGAVVFLGDNIYPSGLPPVNDPGREEAEANIMAQIDAVRDFGGRVVFVPGNHDWGNGGLGGDLETLRRQQAFVERHLGGRDVWIPDGGFPGPTVVELMDDLVLVAIDTQWWLEPNKIYGDTGQYQLELESEFLIHLDDVLRRHSGKRIVVVAHHPLFSNGEHGGYFPTSSDLRLLLPFSRRYLGTPQDLSNRKYRILREGLLSVFEQHPGLVYAAGHEHNLQYFPVKEQHYIVSGAGSKVGYVARNRGEAFARESTGHARILYYRDGTQWLEFWAPVGDGDTGERLWAARIATPEEPQAVRPAALASDRVGNPVQSIINDDSARDTLERSGLTGNEELLPDGTSEGDADADTDRLLDELAGDGHTGTNRSVNPSRSDDDLVEGVRGGELEGGARAEAGGTVGGARLGGTVAQETGPGGAGSGRPNSPTGTTRDSVDPRDADSDDGDQGDTDEIPGEEAVSDSTLSEEDAEDGGNNNEDPLAVRPGALPQQQPYRLCIDDTITRPASRAYQAGSLKRFFLGSGYRDVWSVPVEMPVVDLSCTAGGLTPLQRGGGLQTISLRMEGADGDEYVFRSVDKDPSATIPDYLQETIGEDIVRDQLSAMNPYGAIIIPELARAANILHTDPAIVYVPDSPELGIYQESFGNMVALFETRPDEDQSDEARFGFSHNLVGTPKMFEEVEEDNDESIDVDAWLRARLFDMWIGDWDRHKDQWRWAEFEGEFGTVYEPVPRDRDFAFFRFTGLPKFTVKFLGDPKLRRFSNFGPKFGDVLGLNYNGAAMDRRITGPATREDWIRQADSLRLALTDEVIEEAVREYPAPVFRLIGDYTIRSLKARRDDLPEIAGDYYDLLAHIVDLFGTVKHERFEVRHLDDERVEVIAYKTKKEGDVVRELYRRTFDKDETGQIRIYGFGGNDQFIVEGEGDHAITVRAIGGEGDDRFVDQTTEGAGSTIFYDTPAGTTVEGRGGADLVIENDPSVNAYDPTRFEFLQVGPVASFGYNETAGPFLGGGVKLVVPAFRKYPYASRHVLEANFALRERAYNAIYTGEFIDVYRAWDGDIRAAALAVSNFRSFYGLGNRTPEEARELYNARFQWVLAEPTLRKTVAPFTTVAIGPRFEYANVEPPAEWDDLFSEENPPGPPLNAFTPEQFEDRYYGGLYGSFVINGLDSLVATESGARLAAEASLNQGFRTTDKRFLRLASDFRYFYTFLAEPQLTLGFRVGGAHNIGSFEFYQANTIGGESSLRGFGTTRFSGRTTFYQNVEARVQLFDFNAYLTRGHVGALAFLDNGRVWWDEESPGMFFEGWHQGYGGGLWVSPFDQLALVTTLGFSEDGMQFDLGLGFQF